MSAIGEVYRTARELADQIERSTEDGQVTQAALASLEDAIRTYRRERRAAVVVELEEAGTWKAHLGGYAVVAGDAITRLEARLDPVDDLAHLDAYNEYGYRVASRAGIGPWRYADGQEDREVAKDEARALDLMTGVVR